MLEHGVNITSQRYRQDDFKKYYHEEDSIYGYCINIEGLMEELNIIYCNHEWRLFIDGSVTSIKAVLLHNGNLLPSIPVAYAPNTPENYDTLEKILSDIDYKKT